MKITNVPREATHGIEQTRATHDHSSVQGSKKAKAPHSLGSHHSNVEISENAQLMNEALESARRSPDIDVERVAALKKAIQEGTYQVSSEDIADKLLEQHLNFNFGKNDL